MIVGYLENASCSDPPDVPSALAAVLKRARANGFDDAALLALSSFVSASFVPENLPELEPLLETMDDVAGTEVSVYKALFRAGSALPVMRVQASFNVSFRASISDDELLEWQEDNDAYLTDCISFWWSFGDFASDWDGVLGCEEAGAHLA